MKSAFTRLLFISIAICNFNPQHLYAKTLPPPLVAGTYSIGPSASYLPPSGDPAYSGTYTNLKAAVLDLNANGAAGPVIFEFQLNYTNTETFPITITYQGTAAAPATIRVRSDLSGQVDITGNGGTGSSGALGLIVLEGADFIHFNGNIGGTLNGSNGIKLNTTAVFGAPVINLRNDATHNTFTGLEIWGSGGGNGIQLSTNGGITGDDYTTIQYCTFPGPACSSSPCSTPSAAVYSESTGNSTCKNDHVLIFQNKIYNCAYGVHASNNGNSGYWDVLDNHFYSTSTLNGSFHYAMILQVDNGSGPVNVSGNYIGGSAPFAAGTPMINNDPAMVGIWVSVANSAPSPSNITNNIIKNISFTSLSGSPSVFAILVQSGAVNINNNTIGDPSVTNDISFNTNTPVSFTGISNSSSQTQYAVSISNNAISNIRMQQATNTAGAGEFVGYRYVNNAVHTVAISANTIKSIIFGGLGNFQCMNISGGNGGASNTIVANNKFESIQQTNAALNGFFRGIYCNTAPASYTGNRIGNYFNPNDIIVAGKGLHSGIQVFQSALAAISILNDTVANITLTQTDNITKFTAVDHISSVAGSSVSGNIIKNISAASTRSNVEADAASGFALVGIYTGGPGTIISNNLITGLHATTTGNVNPVVAGICPLYTDNNIFVNKIYDLTNTATGTTNYPVIFGIVTSSILGTGTYSNNMISLQNGSNNNTVRIYGIYDKTSTGSVHNFYHNSIAIGGNETGTGRAASFWRTGSAGTLNLRNNIIYNNRTGSGKYYAIVHESGNAAAWGTSNYNDLFAANTNTLGAWPLATDKTFAAWKVVAGDANSKNSDVWFINNAADLHLLTNANCALDAAGTSSGIITDIDAEARNASTPDIGADEFTNTFFVDAGPEQVVCGGSAVLAGNTILPLGIGTWSVSGGTGSFSPNANTAGAGVNGLSAALNTFKWLVTSGSCSGNATVNITSNIASTDPTGIASSLTEICNGITTGTIAFTVNGGSLGTNATWKLYNADPAIGSPTPLASSATAAFTGVALPSVTTTYFVRAEGTAGPCPPNTNAVSVTVTVNSPLTWYYDEDGDGFYTASPVEACTSPGTGYTIAVTGAGDNCPSNYNPGQGDNDNDGAGDVCDPDDDNDGVPDANDNCALMSNAGQTDTDNDGIGNECDSDDDGDGIADASDNCPLISNTNQTDTDNDGIGDICDADDDNDGVADVTDNCPLISNTNQTDTDNDGIGDICDNDDDGDGIPDVTDNCPLVSNTNQTDTDNDGIGNICDNDDDGDGVPDANDNCPLVSNPNQEDNDYDGQGDACDPDNENPTITCVSNQLRYTDPGKCEYKTAGSEFDPTSFSDNYPGATIKNNYNNSSTLAGAIFNKGTITVIWTVTDASGHTASCSFEVKVEDHQKPTIACPASLTLPAGQNTVTWAEPSGNDNCPGWTVVRTGPAPGSTLPPGTSTISYKVTDASGNFEDCSFTITVTGSVLTATCNPNTIDNTLYFGYTGDQTETITVTPVGGTGPYTIQIKLSRPLLCNQVNDAGDEVWSPASGGTTINNGCPGYPALAGLAPVSTKTISSGSYAVTVTLMGDADVIATITDANGSLYTCSTHIHADDVRCFTGNSGKAKITLCHKTGGTKNPCIKMCVDEDAVVEHLAHGDFLGNCTSNCVAPSMARSSIQQPETINSKEGKLSIKVMPNPTSSFFIMDIKGENKDRVKITIWDVTGRVIEKRTDVIANGRFQIGQKYSPGFYIAEILQGKERIAIRLIKE